MKHLVALIAATAALSAVAVVGFSDRARAARQPVVAPAVMIPGASAIQPASWAPPAPREVRVVYRGAITR